MCPYTVPILGPNICPYKEMSLKSTVAQLTNQLTIKSFFFFGDIARVTTASSTKLMMKVLKYADFTINRSILTDTYDLNI